MTQPAKKIKKETTVLLDADRNPVQSKDDAVAAEITIEYEDGTVEHHLLRKGSSPAPY